MSFRLKLPLPLGEGWVRAYEPQFLNCSGYFFSLRKTVYQSSLNSRDA
jgi:hypothetical protein